MRSWRFLAPVAAFAVTGCLASKSDILLLQDEIRTLRAMQARSDTARRATIDSQNAQAKRTADSLRALSQRFGGFQANVGSELFETQRLLLTLQQQVGMSASMVAKGLASLDERQQSMIPGDPGAPASQGPTAAQMYTAAFDQYRRGSYSTARAGFEELIRRFPDFDQNSAAQKNIAETYDIEKRFAEADSAYQIVVTRYPKSVDAPTALFKIGSIRLAQGKKAEARQVYQRVIAEYPRSVEAELAEGKLKEIK